MIGSPSPPIVRAAAPQHDQLLGVRESLIGGVAAAGLVLAIWAGSLGLQAEP